MRGFYFCKMTSPARRRPFDHGFTLVELVSVLILVGILAAYASSRFFDSTAFNVRSTGDQTQSMLGYAQKVAIAQHRDVFVVFSGSGGALCFDAGCNTHVLTPTNKPADITLPTGVSAAISRPIAGFYFNALGQPFDIGNTEPDSTFATTTITLSGSGVSRTVTVEAETGYVH